MAFEEHVTQDACRFGRHVFCLAIVSRSLNISQELVSGMEMISLQWRKLLVLGAD
jgi:hypothetical protein